MTVSRQGLTHCPQCRTYVRVSDDACIACGADLDDASDGALSMLRRGFARTRGGIIAASLLGLTTLWGCGDDDKTPTDARARDVAPELGGADAAYGLPPVDFTVDKSPDTPAPQDAGIDSGADAATD